VVTKRVFLDKLASHRGPAAWIPVPGSRHQQVLGEIVRECRPAGNLVPDAHLAALALEHGLTVVSTDTDLAKFPGVTWLNPVSAAAS
jgi:predicted nucleic acid-binding protein